MSTGAIRGMRQHRSGEGWFRCTALRPYVRSPRPTDANVSTLASRGLGRVKNTVGLDKRCQASGSSQESEASCAGDRGFESSLAAHQSVAIDNAAEASPHQP